MKIVYATKLEAFEWYLFIFILLNPFSPGKIEKLEKSIFDILKFVSNLNINKWRTTSANSINLSIIRKLIKTSFKDV